MSSNRTQVETNALAVDLSSTQKQRATPTLLISTVVSARLLGTVASGDEHYQAARCVLDHFDRVSGRGEQIFGVRLDVRGLGVVYLMMVEAEALVFGVIAESEFTRWHAGELAVLTREVLTAHELYGEARPPIAERNLGGGFRLFALGDRHVVITTRLARAWESPAHLARELLAMPVALGLCACRVRSIDLCLGRLPLKVAGRAVELTLACLPSEQLAAARVVRRVKRVLAAWAKELQ